MGSVFHSYFYTLFQSSGSDSDRAHLELRTRARAQSCGTVREPFSGSDQPAGMEKKNSNSEPVSSDRAGRARWSVHEDPFHMPLQVTRGGKEKTRHECRPRWRMGRGGEEEPPPEGIDPLEEEFNVQ